MDKETSKIVKSFRSKLSKRFKLDRMILFGSRARGDNFKESDFDFVLVSEDFKNLHFLKRMAKILCYWDYPYDLEALCYTNEEFDKLKKQTTIVQLAMEEGVRLI